ncbi:AbrB/MazE/SpoVT family DNA-binding domain-containing protein [Lachnospiraceae bacterium 62-35]
MEVAKLSSKGQITIPVSIRNKRKLKPGDKVVIFEENGRFCFENSAMLAFKRTEKIQAAEEAGIAAFQTEERNTPFAFTKGGIMRRGYTGRDCKEA